MVKNFSLSSNVVDEGFYVIDHPRQNALASRLAFRECEFALDDLDNIGIRFRLFAGVNVAVDDFFQFIGIELRFFD